MADMSIESHEDESVTLRAGSITAHIRGDSWKDANQAAHTLGGIVLATYEAAEVRRRLGAMLDLVKDLETWLGAAERHAREVADYADMVRRSKSTPPEGDSHE